MNNANYNLSGLISRIKTRLNDAEYSDDTITQFINDAYFDILGDAEYQFLERHYQAHTQNSDVLLLPPDFQALIHLTASTDKGMWGFRYMTKEEFFNKPKNSSQKDYYFTIFGNNLFYNVPDISNEIDEDGEEQFYTLDLYYLARPRPLVLSTDMPVLPYEFSEALVLSALSRCERLRDNFDYAQIYENKADDLITNMKLRYCPRQLEGDNRAKLPVFEHLRH